MASGKSRLTYVRVREARARSFYEVLGWRGAQQPDGQICFFQAGGMVFGLWTALGGHALPDDRGPDPLAAGRRCSRATDGAMRT